MDTTTKTIVLAGKTYSVELDATAENGKGCYHLRGSRGAHYRTMRNIHEPHKMFLVNSKRFAKCMLDIWLTDGTGSLRAI